MEEGKVLIAQNLATGLRRAIAKRPIDAEQINGLLSQKLASN
jgi:transcriptional regulator NrdR family protein